MKCKFWLAFALVFLTNLGTARAAPAGQDCYVTFYQTKDAKCIDQLIDMVRKQEASGSQARSAPQAAIGFLAQIFREYPEQKERLLAENASPRLKSVYLAALVRAGELEVARKYADAIGWPDGFNRYRNEGVLPLNSAKPVADPGENDLLIGAYMASGNTEYVTRILANYRSADDGMVSDAIRIALMSNKFGPRLTPPGREGAMARVACDKYQCKVNLSNYMRLMTLASGLWALRSLAQHDEGIKKALVDFFKGEPRIQKLSAREDAAFTNYLTLVVAYAGIKDNPKINGSLSVYERFGTPEDAMSPLKRD